MPRGSSGVKKEIAKKAAPVKNTPKKAPIAEAPKRGRGRPPGSGKKAKTTGKSHILDQHKFKKPAAVGRSAQPGISITVQIPPLRRPKISDIAALKAGAQHRRIRRAIIVVIALVCLAGGGYFVKTNHDAKLQAANNKNTSHTAVRTAPTYAPLIPTSADTKSTSFDGQRNLVSYDTTFSDARITVSEQALPGNFLTDPTAIMRAADSLNAQQRVQTAKGTVYIANSTVDKSQMGLFADTGAKVLLFIHTDKQLDDASWKSFIELMQTKSWADVSKG